LLVFNPISVSLGLGGRRAISLDTLNWRDLSATVWRGGGGSSLSVETSRV
jgi:hypothetical protein